jgi:hypothetical protein
MKGFDSLVKHLNAENTVLKDKTAFTAQHSIQATGKAHNIFND